MVPLASQAGAVKNFVGFVFLPLNPRKIIGAVIGPIAVKMGAMHFWIGARPVERLTDERGDCEGAFVPLSLRELECHLPIAPATDAWIKDAFWELPTPKAAILRVF